MATIKPLHKIQYIQVEKEGWKIVDADIIAETAVTLTVNGETWLSFMCTPVELEALAIGFLYNEGLITSRKEIENVRLCPTGDNVDVWLNHSIEKPKIWLRTSGCTGGMTSIQNNPSDSSLDIDNQQEELKTINLVTNQALDINGLKLTLNQIADLIDQFFEAQTLYRQSGGVHSSGLSDGKKIIILAEDIGRHNTLDKISGRCLLDDIQLKRRILLTTGRISSEMLQKAARLDTSIVISRTSPSSLSIQMAERNGITLIGYARRTNFRIFTHPERIQVGSRVATLLKENY